MGWSLGWTANRTGTTARAVSTGAGAERSRWWVSSSSAGGVAPVSSWNRRTLNHSKGTSALIGSGGVLHLWVGEVGEALAGKQRRWGPPVPCLAHSWRPNSTSVCVRARQVAPVAMASHSQTVVTRVAPIPRKVPLVVADALVALRNAIEHALFAEVERATERWARRPRSSSR